MDQVIKVFSSLGADETVFIQFGIVVLLYFVLKDVLFAKLQFVLDLRESKTTVLDGDANSKFSEAEKLSSEYNSRIEEAKIQAHTDFVAKKSEIEKRAEKTVREAQDKYNAEYLEKRTVVKKEVEEYKADVFQNKEVLLDQLVEKLVQ